MVQAVIPTTVVGLQGRAVAATPAPTNNQALIWNGTAWVPGGPYLTAAGAPYIATNYVDNSGFTVNQRNAVSGGAAAAGYYMFDRWKAGASGCTLTFTASPASTVVTITAGTVQQVVEGTNFINSSYTLSWAGSATGRVNTGAYVASPITFTGAPNTNVTIEFQGGTLGQVQLQIGTQPTQWQPQPAAVELTRCQRFYQVFGFQMWLYAAGGNLLALYYNFVVTMRSSPSMFFIGTPTAANVTNPGIQPASNGSYQISYTVTATGGTSWNGTVAASADL